MREILFRGKRTDNHKWIEGTGVFNDGVNTWIFANEPNRAIAYGMQHYVVKPETVGQYTGLTDKNGKKIFEGDIINIEYPITTVKCAVVEYVGSAFVGSTDCDAWDLDNYYALEVIGNIHDNPELLKGE